MAQKYGLNIFLQKQKLDKQNQAKIHSTTKTTIKLCKPKMIYNLNSFETSPVLKHAEHATS